MKFKYINAVLAGLILSASCFINVANAGLINSYDFNVDFSDTLGNGNDLTSFGGTIGGGSYSFADNQGLRLTSALTSTSDYAIEINIQNNDDLIGYKKLIDFQDLTSESGLYLYENTLDFYPDDTTAGTYLLNTDLIVGLARSGGTVELFLDGVSVYSFLDVNGEGVSSLNILNFFIDDDNQNSLGESFSGSVNFIRIHDDSSTFGMEPPMTNVPEPGTLTIFALGMIGLASRGFKKQA